MEHRLLRLLPLALTLGACTYLPVGHEAERLRAAQLGAPYAAPYEQRELPDLPAAPALPELWARTLRSHGELEALWHEWQLALAGVERDATLPNTALELEAETMLDGAGWDDTTLRLGFDPMQSLWLPDKARAAGERALAEAQRAGEAFLLRRAGLKRELCEAWLEWLAAEREAELLRGALELDELELQAVDRAALAGRGGAELVETRLAAVRARDESARAETRRAVLLARLNVLLAREPAAPLGRPEAWPERTLALSGAELETLALGHDAARAAARAEVRADARRLAEAELAWLPDISPFAGLTGGSDAFLGLALAWPAAGARVRAEVRAARERLAASAARARTVALERPAALLAADLAWRDAQRAALWYAQELTPLARQLRAQSEAAFAGGASGPGGTRDWLAARRLELEVERALVTARRERELALARVEELLGVDLELVGSEVVRG